MRFKKFFTSVLCASLVISTGIAPMSTYASQVEYDKNQAITIKSGNLIPELDISPYFSYTQSVTLWLDFNGSQAETAVLVEGSSAATKITGTLSIKKKNSNGSYTTVKSWKVSEDSNELFYDNTYSVSSRGEYRASFVGKVYSGSNYDSINITKNATY